MSEIPTKGLIAMRCFNPVKNYNQGQIILVSQEEYQKSQNWLSEFFEHIPWMDEAYLSREELTVSD